MYPLIQEKLSAYTARFDEIGAERKLVLQQLAASIRQSLDVNDRANIVYVCTHNARRSHFGQVAAALAAAFYAIDKVFTYSAGTEITKVHEHTIQAIQLLGCKVVKIHEAPNPKYTINFGAPNPLICYSKTIQDKDIPSSHYIAVMTCTDAEQNCPYLPLAMDRIGLPYTDPKIADGTGQEAWVYFTCFERILIESLYVFSLL